MATWSIYSSTGDGVIQSFSPTYSLARSGTNLSAESSSVNITPGQSRSVSSPFNRFCREAFLSFDCSSIIGVAVSATLNLGGDFDNSSTNFVTEARAHSWSASGLTTADWVAGASLSGKTLLATWDSAGGYNDEAYNAFMSEAALLTAVDLHGTLDILLCSAEQTNNSEPAAGNEYMTWYSADEAGTTLDPKLEVITISFSGHSFGYIIA